MKTAVLITNLGTPHAPTFGAVRRYLAEFLSDRRVVALPKLLWWPILYGIILNTRPGRSAKLYRKIWMPEGAPLLHHSETLVAALEKKLPNYRFALGMRYGKPSIKTALEKLKQEGVEKLIVLPLYPQYSATTTASTFDAINELISTWRVIPSLHFVAHYYEKPSYITAIANSIKAHWCTLGRGDKLIFSFHGLPEDYVKKGDPYKAQCEETAHAIAKALELKPQEWLLAYQSRLGPKTWLKPYLNESLKRLAKENVKNISIVCPGFAVDCLETLEEIAMQNSEIFKKAGGDTLHYIPALNASSEQVSLLTEIIEEAALGQE